MTWGVASHGAFGRVFSAGHDRLARTGRRRSHRGSLFNGHLSRHRLGPFVRKSEGAEEREEGVRNAMLCFSPFQTGHSGRGASKSPLIALLVTSPLRGGELCSASQAAPCPTPRRTSRLRLWQQHITRLLVMTVGADTGWPLAIYVWESARSWPQWM